jgi:hypothetical protein
MRPRRQPSGNFPDYPMTTHDQCWQVARETEEYWSGIHYTYDCSSGCYFFHRLLGDLQADWGVCTNPQSPRAGLLTFEHMGCAFYASPYFSGRNPTYQWPPDPRAGKKRPTKTGTHQESVMTRSHAGLNDFAARHQARHALTEQGISEVGLIYVINDQLETLGEPYTLAPESRGYIVLGMRHKTWWRRLQRHRPELRAHAWDEYPRGEVRYHLATQQFEMALDRHIAQHPAHVAALLRSLKLQAGTYRIDDHASRHRCYHYRHEIVDDQETCVDS